MHLLGGITEQYVPLGIDGLVLNEKRNQRRFESQCEQRPTAKADEAPMRLSVAEARRHTGTVASCETADCLWRKHTEKPGNQGAN
jgi:hypothetical protein